MTGTIESLRESSEEQGAQAAAGFVALAGEVADDKDVDAGRAGKILSEANKTIADLEAAVVCVKRIRELRSRLADLPDDLPAQMAKLHQERAAKIKRDGEEDNRLRRERDLEFRDYTTAEAGLKSKISRRVKTEGEIKDVEKKLGPSP